MTGIESLQGHDAFRVASDEGLQVLQLKRGDQWVDLYAFHRLDANSIDFELGNWFTSTHPRSPFVAHVIVQHRTAQTRHILRDLVYIERRGEVETTRAILRSELVPLLRKVFRIDLDNDVRLRALDEPP